MTLIPRRIQLLAIALLLFTAAAQAQSEPIDIGTRRELFVDDYLIDTLSRDVSLQLHKPQVREVAMKYDQPWEGNTSGYPTVMYDGTLYRMIYRGHRMTWESGKLLMANSPVVCYAESSDGIHWERPILHLHQWRGKDRDKLETPTSNNIVWPGSPYTGTFVPFDDTNPNTRPEERFKAVGGNHRVGLHLFTSPDAIHWTKRDEPIFTEGALDSMNTVFWDETRKQYTLYFRTVRDRLRSIDVAYSDDLINWTEPAILTYGDSPPQQMYTNGILPYFRAPHILFGFPTRYQARKITPQIASLPPAGLRKLLGDAYARVASDLTDGLFMSSRDGVQFRRWNEAFIRPQRQDTGDLSGWMYGDNYQSYGLFPTTNEHGSTEISFLVSQSYWQEYQSQSQRYSIRPDGFVSLQAKFGGGECITRPLVFDGNKLSVNYATSAAGSLTIELLDTDKKPIEGFTINDSIELIGNSLDQIVPWDADKLKALAGTPVRIRFVLKDADLYSFQFQK
ncbi:MAG: hypothetical protein CMJ79_05995 [Planctomycetaceae bacterium]|nr:hypothetical protein [Planctomycetaceae bacterium]